jgi:adenosine deaminase
MPDATRPDVADYTKVELHRHLEGAYRLSTVFELSKQAGVPLPAESVEELATHALVTTPVASLEVALAAFAISQNAVRTYDAVRRIASEAVEDMAADNVRVGELRFSPDFLCGPADLDRDLAMEAIWEGVFEACARCDVAIGLIALFSRDLGPESFDSTIRFAVRHRDRLVGFDIAGPEIGFPPSDYAYALGPIRDAGLGLTVHYGESGPPAYVREAVETIAPSRLGHGLSTAHDPDVTALVRDRGIVLEMCPTSNWLTNGVAAVSEHPVLRLLGESVKVTLNTDDPGIMGIDLNNEWRVARDEIGFDETDLAAVTEIALEASFVPDEVKQEARDRHFGWLSEAQTNA